MNARAATWLAWSTCLLCVALLSAKLRDETDLHALNDELVRVVKETMQPAHTGLWLRPEGDPKEQRTH